MQTQKISRFSNMIITAFYLQNTEQFIKPLSFC